MLHELNKWLCQNYLTLYASLQGDSWGAWIGALSFIALIEAFVIAWFWHKAVRTAPKSASNPLKLLVLIFILHSVVGSGFTLVSLWWPAYRVLPFLLFPLALVKLDFILFGFNPLRKTLEYQALGESLQARLDAVNKTQADLEALLAKM